MVKMISRWNLFSECLKPSIIEEIYNNTILPNEVYKGLSKLVNMIRVAERKDVHPIRLVETLQIPTTDCRRKALENIANYSVNSFRIITLDRIRDLAIPEDKRFAIGLASDWRGMRIRAPYVDVLVNYGIESQPKIVSHISIKPKDEYGVPYRKENIDSDLRLIESFLK